MRLLAAKISKLNIGWNERPLTESDFNDVCLRFDVTVVEAPLMTRGFYYRAMGRDFIAVSSRLNGAERLAVLFHELGHFLLHAPHTRAFAGFHGVGRRTRREIEADVFALCALIPARTVVRRSRDELLDEGFSLDLLAARFEIYEHYQL